MSEAALRRKIATGCRIMAHRGLSEDILGHISVRLDATRALIRCRSPQEQGLLFTTPDDVRTVNLVDGSVDHADYEAPSELPIHTETLAARADIDAVLHAHPPWVIAVDLAGHRLVPLVGAYNILAAKMAKSGIPVFPRSALIRRPELAREMLECLGRGPACLMRGHGVTTVGATVEEAVARALAINSLAKMTARVGSMRGTPEPISESDMDELPDLAAGSNAGLLWQHYEQRLAHDGLSVDG